MEQPLIRIDAVGREGSPVVVVDNLSPHPQRLVETARGLTFAPMGPYYPGVRAPVTAEYFDGLADTLGPIMREVFGGRDRLKLDRALYSLATTAPSELALAQRIPHIDGVGSDLVAMIHYLAPPEHGGTGFYRHRRTGFETITADRHRPYLAALKRDVEEGGEPSPAYIGADTALFDQIAAYPAVFNRALIYRGNMLHSALLPNTAGLENDIDRGRLTVASFLTVR